MTLSFKERAKKMLGRIGKNGQPEKAKIKVEESDG